MNTYRICMKVEHDGPAEQDMELVKAVLADSESEAVMKAKRMVRVESPDINVSKIWVSVPEIIRNSAVAKKLLEANCSASK